MAVIDTVFEQILVSRHLRRLKVEGKLSNSEVWVKGRTNVYDGKQISQLSDIKYGGQQISIRITLLLILVIFMLLVPKTFWLLHIMNV